MTQGLCHLPWAGGNKVDVEVRFGDEVGYSTIDRAARETGDVQPIQCHPDKNLAGNENGATAANSSIGCKAS
ncbi:MAG: hypothetical protein U0271_30880 [Polyangiaceae bacterium]